MHRLMVVEAAGEAQGAWGEITIRRRAVQGVQRQALQEVLEAWSDQVMGAVAETEQRQLRLPRSPVRSSTPGTRMACRTILLAQEAGQAVVAAAGLPQSRGAVLAGTEHSGFTYRRARSPQVT